ncbi:MAG: hypothetical protein Q7S47_00240 [bacterium]|nr:hypothetical protein [bacterium]
MNRLITSLKFYGFVAGIAMAVSITGFIGSALQLPASQTAMPEDHVQPTLADGAVPVRFAAASVTPTIVVTALKPSIVVVDPPAGTANVWRIVLRGENWGPYNTRVNPEVFLVNAAQTDLVYPMKVDRNYRDCTVKTINDSLGQKCVEELFMAIQFTDTAKAAPPGDYLLYVQDESGQGAVAPFMLIALPDLSKSTQPTLAISPSHGPIGSYVVVSAGGFAKRSSLLIRLDGVKIGGSPMTDENGFFTDVGIVIPQTITVNGKSVAITPGAHTIEVVNTSVAAQSARVAFTVDGSVKVISEPDPVELYAHKKQQDDAQKQLTVDITKEKQLEKQKDALQKETTTLVKKQKKSRLTRKEGARLDVLKKEQSKKQKELFEVKKNIEDVRTKKELIDQVVRVDVYLGKPCVSDLPITFQPGCVPPAPPTTIEQSYAGKPCRADMAITFQPGCMPGEVFAPVKVYEGKPCNSALPRVWQEGCIEQPRQVSTPPTAPQAQKCDPLVPEYSQKGCVK